MEEALKSKCDLIARERARSEKNNEKAILTKEERKRVMIKEFCFQSRKNQAHQQKHVENMYPGQATLGN